MLENKEIQKNSSFGIGLISLLVLFSGMLLIVIAIMSIVTLSFSLKLHEKTQTTLSSLAESENNTNIKLSEIDEVLLELKQSTGEGEYYEKAYIALEKLGCKVNSESISATFEISIDNNRFWKIEIKLLEYSADLRYEIVKKEILQTENWKPEQEINLLKFNLYTNGTGHSLSGN